MTPLIILILCSSVALTLADQDPLKCLMGYMTDVQSWVDHAGVLQVDKNEIPNTVDLSANTNPVPLLYQKVMMFKSTQVSIKYLSLARCQLIGVPPIFSLRDSQGRNLYDTVEYLTFYGNNFVTTSSAGEQYDSVLNATGAVETSNRNTMIEQQAVWTSGFEEIEFSNLKELDLRSCCITVLNQHVFNAMKNLDALYLGENNIYYIEGSTFNGLANLRHLDLSRNDAYGNDGKRKYVTSNSYYIFEHLTNLESLDLTHTELTFGNHGMFEKLNKKFKILSLCNTGLTSLKANVFRNTSLQVLDVSYNNGILSSPSALSGIEDSLTVLYATKIGLQSVKALKNFRKLEILKAVNNEINEFDPDVAKTLSNLKILDLFRNRIPVWFNQTFSLMPNLKYLALKENSISFLTKEMIDDVKYIDYVAMSGNFMICNCHVKDFMKMAYKNEHSINDTEIKSNRNLEYHRGFSDYNKMIKQRSKVDFYCDEKCYAGVNETGRIRLVDFNHGIYVCMELQDSIFKDFYDVEGCGRSSRDVDYDEELGKSMKKLMALIAIPCVLLPLGLLYLFRRNLRYCFITMRNSAMLSLINKEKLPDDGTIFNYDVFVSYCNEDRGWVLDYLLPQIERDCSISACLHERDFQVGLSILENIVSCMDRSRSIMLILSQRFLLSQWCQFEMHLAQHRLLETRREDLILVLLEDIPRRIRPNTLHYLMLTKTYIVWPKEESDRQSFWKRVKKSLMSQKNRAGEGISVA